MALLDLGINVLRSDHNGRGGWHDRGWSRHRDWDDDDNNCGGHRRTKRHCGHRRRRGCDD
jgi:hypothetical protein